MFNLKPWPLLEEVVCEDPFRNWTVVVHHKPLQTKLELRNYCERFDSEDDLTSQVVKMSVTVSNSPVRTTFTWTIILTLKNYCFSREGETRVLVGKPFESPRLPYISSKFNPINTDTRSIQALSIASSLSVLRFDFTCKM